MTVWGRSRKVARAHATPGKLLTAVLMVSLTGCSATSALPRDGILVPSIVPAGATELPSPSSTTVVRPKDCTASYPPLQPMPTPGSMPTTSYMATILHNRHLVVGVDQNSYLWAYRDPRTAQIQGFDIDMLKAVSRAIFGDDRPIVTVVVPNADRAKAVKSHVVDILAETMTITCARKQDVDFSAVYYNTAQEILVPRTSSISSDRSTWGGKRMCAGAGSTSLRHLAALSVTPPIVPVSVTNQTDCLVMLQQGQVDAISTDDTILRGMAAQDPTLMIVGGKPIAAEPYGMAISRDHHDFTAFVNGVLAQEFKAPYYWEHTYNTWIWPYTHLPAIVPVPSYNAAGGR